MSENGITLCVDFDGVIHSYQSGWQGIAVVADPPVPGAIEWLVALVNAGFDVCIYSSRSCEPEGVIAMIKWLDDSGINSVSNAYGYCNYLDHIRFPTQKPPTWLTIDDRAICFQGEFPTIDEINDFKPWNKP